ncbi:MAG TPA: hypothetical protein GX497_03495 [Bacillus bacterium]|nr:hypothetical protein [Bacillus sp. (in: firmicutes)]
MFKNLEMNKKDARSLIKQLGLIITLEKSSPMYKIEQNADYEFAVRTESYKTIGYYYEYQFCETSFFSSPTFSAVIDAIINNKKFEISPEGFLRIENRNHCFDFDLFKEFKKRYDLVTA